MEAVQTMSRRGKEDELFVGGIFSLTGYLSWSGGYKRKGAALKIDMINEAGGINGRPLRLIAYDDRSSPEDAAKIAEGLVLKHRVVAMVGTGSLPVSSAVARVANRHKVPVFLNSGYAVDPVQDLFVFNTSHKTEFVVACAFQHFSEVGIDRIALLMPHGPLGDLGSWLGRRLADQLRIRIVGEERFEVNSAEARSQLERLRSLKPLALFSFVTGEPAARIARTMAQMGMIIPLLVSHGNANPEFLKLVSHSPVPLIVPSGKTMILDCIPESDPCRNRVSDFNRRHMHRFGEPANYYSAELADAIDLLAEGLRSTGKPEGRKVRDAVEGIRHFGGMQGVYDLSPIDHYGTRVEQVVLLNVKEGRWHLTREFSSIDVFQSFHGDERARLIFKLADALTGPYPDTISVSDEVPGVTMAVAAQVGLSCTNLNSDPRFALKLACQEKRELLLALRGEDYTKAKESLNRLLTISLLQHFDAFETLKLNISELFHAFFDAAVAEEGADLETLVDLKYKYSSEWAGLKDQEALCSWIIRAFRETMESVREGHWEKGSGLLKNILRFIEIHLAEDLSVQRIAREVCLSPSRLIHRMRNEYGMTLSDCIARSRMDKAKDLLRETDMSICDIAQFTGYQDQGYFTKVFKKHLECTPKRFRDSFRQRLNAV
jgi:branched-chain amino acid transport system substrate-binding protein